MVVVVTPLAGTWPIGPYTGPQGYWEVASDGGIFSFGGAPFLLYSMGGQSLNAPIVVVTAAP